MLERLARFDQLSFWLGFAAAAIFWWLMARITPSLRQAWDKFKSSRAARKDLLRTGVEYDYRNDFIRYVQGLHLSAPLFSLDEIVLPPHILAPPPLSHPGADILPADILSRVLPYAPDFSAFASTFGAERLTLAKALSKGANLAILSAAGGGKTTALLHLGTQVASLSPDVGDLVDLIPFYVHAADLLLPNPNPPDPKSAIHDVIRENGFLSRQTASRFTNLMDMAFSENRVLLLLDGLDELAPASIERVTQFLKTLRERHSNVRVVAAASPDFYDGLTAAGLVPVRMAGWTRGERRNFISRWGQLWSEHIEEKLWPDSDGMIDASMLQNWLECEGSALTPLEVMLRVWAAFAGDSLGGDNAHHFDAYLRRTAGSIPNAETALERVAMQMTLLMRPVAHSHAVDNWARGNMIDYSEEDLLNEPDVEQGIGGEETISGRVTRAAVPALLSAGLLVRRPDHYLRFAHPAFAGYYAGRGLAKLGGSVTLAGQPGWSMRNLALHYLACCTDIPPILRTLENGDPLHTELLASGHWLRDMRPKSDDRMQVMRMLAALFQNDEQPAFLRQSAIMALALSLDPGIIALCKKRLAAGDPLVRSMSALVLGYFHDEKHVPDLIEALSDEVFQVRAAACFALVHTGTQPAIEIVATVLLHGDEDSQRAAAEALALDPDDGYELLLEAVQVDDLLVRRAAVFGLEKTGRAEAMGIIQQLQLEDEQWIVRNAANQAMLKTENGSPSIPEPFPSLHEADWLIRFAGLSGEGISPGASAESVLLRSLVNGNMEEKLAAMDRYRVSGTAEALSALHETRKNANGELQTAAVLTLQSLRAQGFSSNSPRMPADP